jgi:hypothetical protein
MKFHYFIENCKLGKKLKKTIYNLILIYRIKFNKLFQNFDAVSIPECIQYKIRIINLF